MIQESKIQNNRHIPKHCLWRQCRDKLLLLFSRTFRTDHIFVNEVFYCSLKSPCSHFFYNLLGTQTTAALIGDLTTFRKSLFVKLIQRIFEKIPKDDKIFSKFFRQSRLKLPGRGATTLQKDEEPIFFSLMFSLGPVINPTSGKDFFIWSRKHLILRQTSH